MKNYKNGLKYESIKTEEDKSGQNWFPEIHCMVSSVSSLGKMSDVCSFELAYIFWPWNLVNSILIPREQWKGISFQYHLLKMCETMGGIPLKGLVWYSSDVSYILQRTSVILIKWMKYIEKDKCDINQRHDLSFKRPVRLIKWMIYPSKDACDINYRMAALAPVLDNTQSSVLTYYRLSSLHCQCLLSSISW